MSVYSTVYANLSKMQNRTPEQEQQLRNALTKMTAMGEKVYTQDQYLKNDATGEYATVSAPYVNEYLQKGYNFQSDPVDYSKLGANSAYRQENAGAVQGAFVPPAQITNAPTGYTPPSGSTVVAQGVQPGATGVQPPQAQVQQAQDPVRNAISQLISGTQTAQSQYNQQMNPVQVLLSKIMDTANLQQILTQSQALQQPAINAQNEAISKQLQEANRASDIDAERRGLYDSGIAAEAVRQNTSDANTLRQQMMSEYQSKAMGDARAMQEQQMSAANVLANILGQGRQLTNDELMGIANAVINADQNDIQRLVAMNNIKNDDQRLGLDQQKMMLDFILGQGQLGVDQQNANTNANNVNNNFALGQAELAERARQFDRQIEFDNTLRLDDIAKFSQQLGLNYAQLDFDNKKLMVDTLLNQADLNLRTKQFESNDALIKAQQSKDNLLAMNEAFDALASMKQQGASRAELMGYAEQYKVLGTNVYDQIASAVDSMTPYAGSPIGAPTVGSWDTVLYGGNVLPDSGNPTTAPQSPNYTRPTNDYTGLLAASPIANMLYNTGTNAYNTYKYGKSALQGVAQEGVQDLASRSILDIFRDLAAALGRK